MRNIDISTIYRKSGDDLILFIHGLGCIKESFEGAWGAPALNDYSLLAPDLAGHGDSTKPSDFSYSMEDQAKIIFTELEKYPYKKINIVAHSMGGAIGLFLAEMLGDKLNAFVNVEGSLNIAGPASIKTANASYEKFLQAKMFEQILHGISKSSEHGWKLWAEWMKKSNPIAFYKSSKSLVNLIHNRELVKRFNQLKVKKVYIYGERSSAKIAPVLEAIPKIQKIKIPNAEHFVMTDNPKAFYTNLAQIMSRN